MTISRRKKTPFSRWRGRYHRRKGWEEPIYYLTRNTFDLMRLTTENKSEYKIARSIRESISSIHSDESLLHSRFEVPEYPGNRCVLIQDAEPSIDSSGGSGIVAMRVEDKTDFMGEHHEEDVEIVILHFVSELGVSDTKNAMKGKLRSYLFDGEGSSTGSAPIPVKGSFFEGKMVKLGPTDALFSRIQEALDLLRCQAAEVRVSDDPEAKSREQAEAMNLLMLSDSPALNITGRPGTGKTTVAQFAVPEVLLQPGPKRRDRRILYLTTTHELKSEARREVRNIIRHVYGLSGRQFDSLLDDVQKLVKFQTRDNLISSDPREEEAFESESDIERIANEANEAAKLMNSREKSEWTRIHNNWLKDKGRRSELKRVIKNLVFGLFGSIDEYISWYDGVTDKREKKGVWREIFHNMSLNLYKPWETKFDEENLVKNPDKSENNHHMFLSDFWDPFMDAKKYQEGREKIETLKLLLNHRLVGGKLYGTDGIGHWTHASIMHKLDSDIDSGATGGSGLWSRENANSFDAIVIDESQDFTVRELAIILKRFAIRGSSEEAESSSKEYAPFLFLASGDPLQTVEGSLFHARNTHINAVYEDWKRGIRDESRQNERIDVEAHVGLGNVDHRELMANHRNANPIVKSAVNPIIDRMRDVAINELNGRRSIFRQTPASSRRGLVIRWNDEKFEEEKNKRLADNIWQISAERVVRQIEKIRDRPTHAGEKATVGLLLPVDNIDSSEEVLDAIPDSEDLVEIKEAVRSLFESEAIRKGKREWRRDMLRRAGIYNIISVKGLTLECAIAVGYGKRILASDISKYELMTRLSHYLVACSRPQFVLILHDDEHPDIEGMESSIFTSEEEMDLRNLLNRVEVNLDPTKLLDNAMQYPEDQKFWDMAKGSLDTLSGSEWEGDKESVSREWTEAKEFASFLSDIFYNYHHPEERYSAAMRKIPSKYETETRERLFSGAEKLGRLELLKDKAEDDGQNPIDIVQAYLEWRRYLGGEYGDPDGKLASLFPKVKGWIEIVEKGPTEEVLREIIGDSDGFRLVPEWNSTEEKTIFSHPAGKERRPEYRESVVEVEIPEGWWFKGNNYPMVQPNVWSTPFPLLKQLIRRFREKFPSYERHSADVWKDELEWNSMEELIDRTLDLDWFLTASRKPEELWGIIEGLAESDQSLGKAISAIDWIVRIINRDYDRGLVNSVLGWSVNPESRELLFDLMREWVDRQGLEVDKNGMTALGFMKDSLPDVFSALLRERGSAEWLVTRVRKIVLAKEGDIPIDIKIKHLGEIKDSADGEVRSFSETYLQLLALIKKGDGNGIRNWLLDQSLDKLVRFNQNNTDVTDSAIRVLTRLGLSKRRIMSDNFSGWFGSKLGSTWTAGVWKDKKAREMYELFVRLTGGPNNKKRDGDLLSGTMSTELRRKLVIPVRGKFDSFCEELYKDCVRAGGIPDTAEHPILEYFFWLYWMEMGKEHDRKRYPRPRDILKINVSSNTGPATSLVFREGHNYWNGLMAPDTYNFDWDNISVEVNCNNDHRRAVEDIMTRRQMITTRSLGAMGEIRDGAMREERVPPPSEKTTDGVSEIEHFSNNNPGIRGYLNIRESEKPMNFSNLQDVHWSFRLSGSYRESAIVSLCEGIILSLSQSKKNQEQIFDFIHMDELNRKVEETMRRNPGQGAGSREKVINSTRKRLQNKSRFHDKSESEQNRAIILRAVSNSLLERPGIYVDHVMVGRGWAGKTSNSPLMRSRVALRSTPSEMLHLSVEGEDIVPGSDHPIGNRGGLRLLEKPAKEELRGLNPNNMQLPKNRDLSKEHCNYKDHSRRHKKIKELFGNLVSNFGTMVRTDEKGQEEVITTLPYITGERAIEVESKPSKIVSSTMTLLPYVLLGEEAARGLVPIRSVTWYRSPLDLSNFYGGKMDPWPKIDHRDRNSLYETFDRENMLDSITEQGDGWLLRIFEVVSELDSRGDWGSKEVYELQSAIIENAPTDGLTRMAETILLGKPSNKLP